MKLIKHKDWEAMWDEKTGIYVRNGNPFWSEEGPELVDLSITQRCGLREINGKQANCPYCYQNSTPNGKDISLEDVKTVINKVKRTCLQMALGGGNPNEHPQFVEILRTIRESGIIPNYSTNGNNLTPDVIKATKENCGAVAVSWHEGNSKFEGIEKLQNAGIKTNIHFVVSQKTLKNAYDLLANKGFPNVNAIIFLLYKPTGRASKEDMLKDTPELQAFLDCLMSAKHGYKAGFDSCSVPMLLAKTKVKPEFIETCESCRFSIYVDTNLNVKPCSFGKDFIGNMKTDDFKDIWIKGGTSHRQSLSSCSCDCKLKEHCYGGCPIYPEITICDIEGRNAAHR